MFVDEDQDLLQKFYVDAVNSVVFKTPVSYLQKYEKIDDYAIIANTERELNRILHLIVSRQLEKPARISQALTEQKVDERVNPILSSIIGNKYADIKRELFRQAISRGSNCLLDHNWRIINILGTNWTAKSGKTLLNLTLFVETNIGQRQINLECDIHEVEQIVGKLKQIKQALKA